MGYRSDALSMKENVHGIPEPMEFEEKMSDWESIRRGICQFLGVSYLLLCVLLTCLNFLLVMQFYFVDN